MLVVGNGTMPHAWAAAKAGAGVVTIVEGSRELYQMTRRVLRDNAHVACQSTMQLCCQALLQCSVLGAFLPCPGKLSTVIEERLLGIKIS